MIIRKKIIGKKPMKTPRSQYRYRRTSNLSQKLVGNRIVDHSDVDGAAAISYIYILDLTLGFNGLSMFILDLTPNFNGLGKGNCKPRRETFRFWDLVRFILEDCM